MLGEGKDIVSEVEKKKNIAVEKGKMTSNIEEKKVVSYEKVKKSNSVGGDKNIDSSKAIQAVKKTTNPQPLESQKRKDGNGGRNYQRGIKRSDNPDVLYGRDFEDSSTPIEQIQTEMGEVAIRGKVIAFDSRPIRGEKTILIFDVTDFTDTITVKMFAKNEQLSEILPAVAKGNFIKVKQMKKYCGD